MKAFEKRAYKDKLKRQKRDHMRALRVVKYIDYPFILPDSPVDIEEGYIVSDRDSYEVFASFIFKNVSDASIAKLKIRLSFYLNQNIPYTSTDFVYCQDELTFGIIGKDGNDLKLKESNSKKYIENGATFGSCVYIPLPETYFTKLEVTLLSVEFAGGNVREINTVVAGDSKRFSELDDVSKRVYSGLNIYKGAEEKYPSKVIPQFGNTVWLCCCGNKNPSSYTHCKKCGREKEWQEKSVSENALEITKQQYINDPKRVVYHDKSRFKQNKYLESDKEIEAKIEQYEKAMKNIALEEKQKHKRQVMLIPKIILIALVFYLIVFVLKIILEFQVPEDVSNAAFVKALRFF